MAFASRHPRFRIVSLLIGLLLTAGTVARGDDIAEFGLAMIPEDAAFVSATLRLREQYDRIVGSKAFAAILKLPGVSRALDSLEEQKTQPGSPLSILDTFMQLPENEEALALLEDMVATDTFLYGEPSCIGFVELLRKVQQAQQAANILSMARGDASVGGFGGLDGIEFDAIEEDEAEDEDEDDGAAAPRRVRAQLARFQVAQADLRGLSSEELTAKLIIKTLADNADLIAIPDIVWGFKTTNKAAAETQLKRIEVLMKLAAQANPDLADAVERKTIAGSEFVTFTFKPDAAMLRQAAGDVQADEDDDLEKILAKAEELEVVFAVGVVGDRVIVSLGDSTDHVEKLGKPAAGKGLLDTKPFVPLLEHRGKPITAVSYVSEAMRKAVASSTDDIDQLANLADTLVELADLPPEAAVDARADLKTMSEQYRKWLPVPGPWMAFSFIGEQGYEGYAWDWSKNGPLDGSKRLELLEHAGGAPLGVIALRSRTETPRFADFVSWFGMGWRFFTKHVLPKADEDVRERFAEFDKHFSPLGKKLVDIIGGKLVPSLANGQVSLVLDAKSRTKRIQSDLPESVEPLPLIEPAIVLGLDDPQLFREGLSDLFALGDELVDAVREMDPDSVPADYRVADPEKTKVEGGTVWSWKLDKTGLDDQVRPAIAVGHDAAVFSLVPKQAGRLIVETPLETGSQLSQFDEPLGAAAALDFAGLVDALQPWVVYLTRYGCVQQRDGNVDPDTPLGADAENPQAKDALEQAKVVFEAIKSLRAAVAETTVKPDATVTHWRNVIRDTK